MQPDGKKIFHTSRDRPSFFFFPPDDLDVSGQIDGFLIWRTHLRSSHLPGGSRLVCMAYYCSTFPGVGSVLRKSCTPLTKRQVRKWWSRSWSIWPICPRRATVAVVSSSNEAWSEKKRYSCRGSRLSSRLPYTMVYIAHTPGRFSMLGYLHGRNSATGAKKKVGVGNTLSRAIRRRIVRYWHPLGCRAMEPGKPPQGCVW